MLNTERHPFIMRKLSFGCLFISFSFLAFAQIDCENGMAGTYPCSQVDLVAFFSNTALGGNANKGNDIWGWTDVESGREFAIMSLYDGVGFVEIISSAPKYLGFLAKHGGVSSWGDVRTYGHYAYIGSENRNQGIQVFDLNQLLHVSTPQIFETTNQIDIGTSNHKSHNLSINVETGFLYVVGSAICAGGILFYDLSDPLNPAYVGCFGADGYTHDVTCFIYQGPSTDYVGKEICVASNEDWITLVDVTDKKNPEEISKLIYPGVEYTHQAWVTGDQKFVLYNDEKDELLNGHKTRTHLMNIEDLENPVYLDYYESDLLAVDHNLFIKGNLVFQSNYEAGMRILDISALTDDPRNEIVEVAHFDTWPSRDSIGFSGNWGNYPFFKSGHIAASNRNGLFILNPQLPHFTLNTDKMTRIVCPNESITFKIEADAFAGFTETIDLQAVSLPVNVMAQFSDDSLVPGESVILTLTGIGSANGGYSFMVRGEGRNDSGYHDVALSYVIVNPPVQYTISNQLITKLDEAYATETIILDNVQINLNATLNAYGPVIQLNGNTEVEEHGSLCLYSTNVCQTN